MSGHRRRARCWRSWSRRVLAGCVQRHHRVDEHARPAPAGDDGDAANGVILMAQSVPTASWVPCLRTALPLGWGFDAPGRAERHAPVFWLDSDRDGRTRRSRSGSRSPATPRGPPRSAATGRACSASSGSRMTTPRYEGERYYVFDGRLHHLRCSRLTGDNRGEPLALATQVVGAVTRDDLRDQVHEESDGRLRARSAGERVSHDRHRDRRRRATAATPALAPAARPAAVRRAAGRRLRLVPAAVHQHRRRLDVGASDELGRGRRSCCWRRVWNLATYQFVVVSTMPGHDLRGRPPCRPRRRRRCPTPCSAGRPSRSGLTYAMNSSWGFSRSRTSVSLLVSGLWNNFAKLGLPVLALALLAFSSHRRRTGRVIAGARRGGRRWSPPSSCSGCCCAAGRAPPGSAGGGRGSPRRSAGRSAAAPVHGLGPGDDEVPRPHGAAAARPLALDHPGDAGQPPLAVPRAAAGAALRRGGRRPGEPGRGARGLRLRPAADRDPVHPGRARAWSSWR